MKYKTESHAGCSPAPYHLVKWYCDGIMHSKIGVFDPSVVENFPAERIEQKRCDGSCKDWKKEK